MIYDILAVVVNTLVGVAAAAILVLGFAFLIFLGDANARGKPLVSRGFDWLALLAIYLSWFAPLWWFGFSRPLLMVACGATTGLCLIYAASYRTTMSRHSRRHAAHGDAARARSNGTGRVPRPERDEAIDGHQGRLQPGERAGTPAPGLTGVLQSG
jgi:hypothetical protein